MEENIQKILQEKDENVVQFNLINTTNQNQFVDLFNSANLTGISFNPSPTFTPNTSLGTFIFPFGTGGVYAFNKSNGDIYIGNPFSNLVYVYDSNFNPITTITLGFPFVNTSRYIQYNPANNTMFIIPQVGSPIKVIDCLNYTILTTIITPPIGYICSDFCSFNNCVYITGSSTGQVFVIDLFFSVSIISVSPQPYFIVYDSNQNRMYFGDNITGDMNYIDCFTNTYIPISITFPVFGFIPQFGASFCTINNTIYVPFSTLGVTNYNTTTDTFLPNLFFSNPTTPFTYTFDSNQNIMYVSYSNQIIYFNPSTNNELGVINTTLVNLNIQFNPFNNQIGVITNTSGLFELITTINVYSVPYYVTGSANYNAFVNNLNNEPVFIQMVRLLVQNQDQLNNELQLTTIDSNGNQIFMPNFPINQVSAYQQQGNIGEITLKDVVFDGRTYINQYQLNAYESMSFEIYYKQLDLTSATPNFPIFFKPKVQLKEYIKKELNL